MILLSFILFLSFGAALQPAFRVQRQAGLKALPAVQPVPGRAVLRPSLPRPGRWMVSRS